MTDDQNLQAQPPWLITTAPPAPRHRRGRAALIAGVTAAGLFALAGVGGGAFALGQASTQLNASGTSSIVQDPTQGSTGTLPYGSGLGTGSGSSGSGTGTNGYGYGYGYPGSGSGSLGSGSGAGSSGTAGTGVNTPAVAATQDQTAGVVTIVSELTYQGARSAGTGIVLSADGLILTNNHVVEGSTSIAVTDELTGREYQAAVVGTDATHDIAVLQLKGASGLTTADLETGDAAAVGDAVTAVGNAEGTGDLVAASGTVTALGQTITTQSEAGVSGETLNDLIQVSADIVSGDSGGPLLDSDGDVVGIDTAASSGSATVTGFAIPIADALDVVAQIQKGVDTDTVQIGYPGFLGVGLAEARTGSGALLSGVVDGGPAADAGLAAGDTITSVDGRSITSADALSAAIAALEPGDSVTLTWTTAAGTTASGTVTLAQGPAA
ncbi:S1C family serine protease [Herbiconiux solani]|uniref:S1C family serine protease n=1 Tax=Herbiconiux solani TaxID=661329 RepID=UPI0008245B74|nr:trypsin-like peptidase domain-containing protein [Herbiconiux solani]